MSAGAQTIRTLQIFTKVSQGQGHLIFLQEWQELININTYVKYESCMSTGAHTIGNYTFLQKKVKGQGHKFKQLIWLESPCHKEHTCEI